MLRVHQFRVRVQQVFCLHLVVLHIKYIRVLKLCFDTNYFGPPKAYFGRDDCIPPSSSNCIKVTVPVFRIEHIYCRISSDMVFVIKLLHNRGPK